MASKKSHVTLSSRNQIGLLEITSKPLTASIEVDSDGKCKVTFSLLPTPSQRKFLLPLCERAK